jgi:hypothetical protein
MNKNTGILTKISTIRKDLGAKQKQVAYIKDFHVWYISLVENTVNNILPTLDNITKHLNGGTVKFGNFNYKNLSEEPIVCKDGTVIMSEREEWYHAFNLIKKTRYSHDGIDILSK